jgi:hypothetical protein
MIVAGAFGFDCGHPEATRRAYRDADAHAYLTFMFEGFRGAKWHGESPQMRRREGWIVRVGVV